ncbi:hypothetical protein FRC07_000094, partial [Ceratobasidium sp. 392]
MSRPTSVPYSFQQPTPDLNYDAQLQECAIKNHASLDWHLLASEYFNGTLVHSVYAIINGVHQAWAVEQAGQLKKAKNEAARTLIYTPGAL